MVQDPLYVMILAVVIFLVLLAIFTFFTYLFLRMAVNLEIAKRKKK